MAAPVRLDEQVTIEKRTVARDFEYGTEIEGSEGWVVVADHIWANCQDVLPSRGESTANGVQTAVTRTRLRIQIDWQITAAMRVTLHDKGDRRMQVTTEAALLDDRRHMECMLEGYSHG